MRQNCPQMAKATIEKLAEMKAKNLFFLLRGSLA